MMDALPFQQTEIGCRIDGVGRWEVRAAGARAAVRLTRFRRAPWLHEGRVVRFGRGLTPEQARALVDALAGLARSRSVLRLRVEALSERPADLEAVGEACGDAGFRPATERRSYDRTAWIDLAPSEDEILAGFHKTARQNVRAPGKKGFEVRPIVDPGAAATIRELLHAAFQRTGGVAPTLDWEALIDHTASEDAQACIAGLFRQNEPGTRNPLSFAVAYLHGDVAEYAHAGSVRDRSIKVSLLYTVAWELMRWARSRGATAWDFGGVTVADADDDSRSGITDFKRYFSDRAVDVGREWVLEIPRGPGAWLRRLSARVTGR